MVEVELTALGLLKYSKKGVIAFSRKDIQTV